MKMTVSYLSPTYAGCLRLFLACLGFLILSTSLFAQYPAGSPAAINGKLKLVGNQLSNECGNAVQLRGMSTHGPQWFPNCYTTSALDALVNDWKIDVFRVAMYVQEGGYVNDPTRWKGWIDNMVDECGRRGIYCLIDWHVLNPGDPWANITESRDFWTYMATKHGSEKHVLYEIANEPNGVDWPRVKSYAEDIIPRIRAIDPNTIIIVGTPTWSQDVDVAANSPLNFSNLMYTLHFYSGTHTEWLRGKANTALSKGLALFVTEFGTSQASGDGGPYLDETQLWMDWMANNKISWANWSFADKSEVSAALNPGACGTNWNNTSPSGTFIKQHIISPADNFVCNNIPNPTQSPFAGVINLPGVVEAENFDNGGEGVAYHDADAGNKNPNSPYRNEGVDIEPSSEGGYNLNFSVTGEWTEYSVNVTKAGSYTMAARVASPGGGRFHLELDGATIGGNVIVPVTGGWQNWVTVTKGVILPAGQHMLRFFIDQQEFNTNKFTFTFDDIIIDPRISSLPGVVEAENFDAGGEGVAYHDNDVINNGGQFRQEGVDIENCSAGGFNVGWIEPGEWIQYAVNVNATGSYILAAQVASPNNGGSFHLELDRTNVSGAIAVPNTGGWQTWVNASKPVALTAGLHTLRVAIDAGGFNLNKLTFSVAPTAGDGLMAQYFNGQNFNTSVLTRKEANINFNWGEGSPAAGVNVDGFSTRWTGQILPRFTGNYTFHMTSDNGRRVWVNNMLLIDKWVDDWDVEYTGTIALTAGQKVNIKVEYFENFGGANAKLEWSGAGQAREVIPQSQLFSTAVARLAIAEATSTASLQLSPNPADNTVTLAWSGLEAETVTLSVVNAYGQQVAAEQLNGNQHQLNTGHFSKGLYIVTLRSGKTVATKKLIVNH
ncbi:MAG: cellulase family glycosylhydrolase [Bacteroidota bacterium]